MYTSDYWATGSNFFLVLGGLILSGLVGLLVAQMLPKDRIQEEQPTDSQQNAREDARKAQLLKEEEFV